MTWVDPATTLRGEHVRLEPLAFSHASDLLVAAQDDAIWSYMSIHRPQSIEDVHAWITATLTERDAGESVPFAIVEPATDRAIGSTRYMDIQPENNALEIGWTWLGSAYWRSAINTECKYLLLCHAFETLDAHRVQLKTDLRNVRSQNAIARLGAMREGVLREHRIVKGYRRSSVYFSILAPEWPEVKARLEGFRASSHVAS
jgi:RimJ/RimL family protein N-acetyltransferase